MCRRWRWRGLARLEGQDMGVGIMWWRGGGLRTRRVVTPQPVLSCDVHGSLFVREVLSGLQYDDEQDCGS